MNAPQADDIIKIMDLPLAIAEGADSHIDIAKRYGFDDRQAYYYLEACGMLGFIVKGPKRYCLTDIGRKYVSLDITQRKSLLAKRVLTLPIVSIIVAELLVDEHKTLSKEEVDDLVAKQTLLVKSVAKRRAQTIMSWLRWVGEETESLEVGSESVKMVATQK